MKITVAPLLTFLCLLSTLSFGDLLGVENISGTVGASGVFTNTTAMIMNRSMDVQLFRNFLFDESHIGQTFHITSDDDDSGFSSFSTMLTNGINDSLMFGMSIYGSIVSESNRFGGSPDFAGYRITEIYMHLDNLSFRSPGRDPNDDGDWTDITYEYSLGIMGEVIPEPGSAALLCVASVVVFLARNKKH